MTFLSKLVMTRRYVATFAACAVVGCAGSVFEGSTNTGKKTRAEDSQPGGLPAEDKEDCSPANMIDFEDQTGNNIPINTQYKDSHGVSFRMTDNSPVMLATKDVGPLRYTCNGAKPLCSSVTNGVYEVSAGIMGQKFIAGTLKKGVSLEIEYAKPVKAASGYLLDLDGGEYFVIEARDAQDNVVATNTSLDARKKERLWMDGRALPWDLASEKENITKILFHGQSTGQEGEVAYIAFDRFSPAAVCK